MRSSRLSTPAYPHTRRVTQGRAASRGLFLALGFAHRAGRASRTAGAVAESAHVLCVADLRVQSCQQLGQQPGERPLIVLIDLSDVERAAAAGVRAGEPPLVAEAIQNEAHKLVALVHGEAA